jgi:hypothetical protein
VTQPDSETPQPSHSGPFWIRNDVGRVWGPFGLDAIGRVNVGRVDPDRIHVSTDGRSFVRIGDYPQVLSILEQVAATAAAQAAARRPPPPPPREAPPPPTPRVVLPAVVEDPGPPESGVLETHSTINLYSRVASLQLSGRLSIETVDGVFGIIFKRGTPEAVEVPQPAVSMARFLAQRVPFSAEVEQQVVAAAGGSDGALIPALMSLGLVPQQDLFTLLGAYSVELLGRALSAEKGPFSWTPGVAPPPGSFAFGDRWALICQWVRGLTAGAVRRRLGDRTSRAVYRSSGARVTMEHLRLTAQEARIIPYFDGTRSPEQVTRELAGEAELVYRTALLLGEASYLSFGPELKRGDTFVAPSQSAVEKVSAGAEPVTRLDASATPLARVSVKAVAVKQILAPPAEPPSRPLITPPPRPAAQVAGRETSSQQPLITPPPRPAAIPALVKPAVVPVPPKPAIVEDVGVLRTLHEKWRKTDHFEVLGVDRKANATTIKAAYIHLAKQHHPDTVADPALGELRQAKADLTSRVNEAYQAIGDDQARTKYLAELAEGAKVDVGPILQAEEDFLRATILVKARKFAEAVELLDRAILMNPGEPEFFAWRAWARFVNAKDKRREYVEAVAECTRVAKESPMCVAAPLFIGNMAKIIGEPAKAEAAFKQVLAIDPNNIEANRELRLARR